MLARSNAFAKDKL